jgi:hypothetical protein
VFAGLLNKGFRGSLVPIVILFFGAALLNYFSSQSIEQEYYPNLFYNFFTRNIGERISVTALNFCFIGLGLLIVNLIILNQEIVDKQNYFPVFIYLLLCIAGASPSQITSQIFTNVIVLYAVYKLFDIYRRDTVLRPIFDAAYWLSVSAFITISSIIFFPLFFIILLILRPFHWREWVIALLGFFMPVFFYECMAYLSDFNQWYLFDATSLYLNSLKVPSFSEYFLPISIAFFVLLVISIFYNLMYGFGNTVKKQRTKSILLWFIFFSVFGFFSGGANSSSILLTYAFPLSFFVGDFLYQVKQIKFVNTIMVVLLFCVALIFLGRYGVI